MYIELHVHVQVGLRFFISTFKRRRKENEMLINSFSIPLISAKLIL